MQSQLSRSTVSRGPNCLCLMCSIPSFVRIRTHSENILCKAYTDYIEYNIHKSTLFW